MFAHWDSYKEAGGGKLLLFLFALCNKQPILQQLV
jgi:hypothetical protein